MMQENDTAILMRKLGHDIVYIALLLSKCTLLFFCSLIHHFLWSSIHPSIHPSILVQHGTGYEGISGYQCYRTVVRARTCCQVKMELTWKTHHSGDTPIVLFIIIIILIMIRVLLFFFSLSLLCFWRLSLEWDPTNRHGPTRKVSTPNHPSLPWQLSNCGIGVAS